MIKNILRFCIRTIKYPRYFRDNVILFFISCKKRYKDAETRILKSRLKYIDSASFVSMYCEIFQKEVYKFNTNSSKPYIIDAGANIGLASIYFKKIYPESEIVCFEPDEKINGVLKENIKSFSLDNVRIIKKGLWKNTGELKFSSDGADGGRINRNAKTKLNTIAVQSLRPFLNRKVDFLKVDIEGAEDVVIEDCSDILENVEHLFVEYHSFKDKNQSLDKILKILTDAQFRYYIEPVGISSKHPFMSINQSNNIDLQLNIYAYKNL